MLWTVAGWTRETLCAASQAGGPARRSQAVEYRVCRRLADPLLIGTPPNSVLIGLLENEYNMEISFLKWMTIGLPFSAPMIGVIYLVLTHWMFPNKGIEFASSNALIAQKLAD